ncbi:MAG: hypothetical protein RL417_2001 [Pseudomonadota bacterium]|jgi:hypothetical protein
MANVVSGSGNTSQFDNVARFHQLVQDYIADCPQLAREYLQLHGNHVTPEAINRTARDFLPEYTSHIAKFLETARPPVSKDVQEEALADALTKLLVNEHLGLAAEVLVSPDLPITPKIREQIRQLAEFEMISALQSERLEEIVELGTALDPLFFHHPDYCTALCRTIFSYLETDRIDKIATLIDAPVQIPDVVIFRLRSDIEEGILRHTKAGGSLATAYALSDMFMLSDFFRSTPFLDAVKGNLERCLQGRDLAGACRLADDCVDFPLLRRGLSATASAAVMQGLAEFRYFASDPRSRENSQLLEMLNATLRNAVQVFRLPKELVRTLPPLPEDRRVYRLGHQPHRLIHPPRRERDE